jgi:hypothetical protein
MGTSWQNTITSLFFFFKPWSQGFGKVTIGRILFTCVYTRWNQSWCNMSFRWTEITYWKKQRTMMSPDVTEQRLSLTFMFASNQSIVFIVIRLIDYLLFYTPLKIIPLIWRRHHYRWRAAKFRPILGALGLWTGGGARFFRSHPKDRPIQSYDTQGDMEDLFKLRSSRVCIIRRSRKYVVSQSYILNIWYKGLFRDIFLIRMIDWPEKGGL